MANLYETSSWESGIYQLEITDPIMGGPDGHANIQAKQLANRTLFLKDAADRIEGTLTDLENDLVDSKTVLDNIIAYNPALFAHALNIYWQHSDADPQIELFGEKFELHHPTEHTITSMISNGSGDDSIDINNTTALVQGDFYVMTGGGQPDEIIRVKEVLTSTRFLMYGVAAHTRYSGTMKQLTGTKDFGECTFLNNGTYLTHSFDNPSYEKTVDIFYKHSQGGVVKAYVSDAQSNYNWVELTHNLERTTGKKVTKTTVTDHDNAEVTTGFRLPVFGRYQFKLTFEFNGTDHPGVTNIKLFYFYLKNMEGAALLDGATQYILDNLPHASLSQKGIVQLSNSYTSTDQTKAATELAVSSGIEATVTQALDSLYVRQPLPLTPAQGATGASDPPVTTTPTLSATTYANIYTGDTRTARHFQLDLATGNFSSPERSFSGNVDSWAVTPALEADTTYKFRCRDEAASGKFSLWSVSRSFSTGDVGIGPITLQVEGQFSNIPEQPTLNTSLFNMASGIDTHASTDWWIGTTNEGAPTEENALWSKFGATGSELLETLVPPGILSENTQYFFKARHNGMAFGSSAWASVTGTSLSSFIPPFETMAIGTPVAGGYFAGIMNPGQTGTQRYALIVAPKSGGESTAQWKTTQTSTAGTFDLWDGLTNSNNMNNTTHPAAYFCRGLSLGGFTDWYLPAHDELELLYRNFKPTTQDNFTGTYNGGHSGAKDGFNPNSEPPSAAYTYMNPTQTIISAFAGGSEAFAAMGHWSSSGASATNAFAQYFSIGNQNSTLKTTNLYVRAVRRFPL